MCIIIGSTTINWTALVNNRLYHVNDVVGDLVYNNDVDDMGTFNSSNVETGNNFQFDELGNLNSDNEEEIDNITWTVSGKIASITRISGSTKPDLEYGYYADGQRLYKLVKPKENNGDLKQELYWVYTYYVRDAQGNVMAIYNKTMSETQTADTYIENLLVTDWYIFGSDRLGTIQEDNALVSTREFTKFGTASNGSWADRTYTGAATLMTMNTNIFYLTRGRKQYELSNHLGNVLVTIQDRKQSKDVNADDNADFYVAYLRTVTDYYAFGSAMPGIGGSVPRCTVTQTQTNQTVVDVNEDFNSGGTGGFAAGSGARTVSNPSGNQLHLESIWSTRPLANRTVSLVNGREYTLNLDIVGFSVVSGYTHTVRVRILLPGSTQSFTYTTTGTKSITFTSNTTGNVTIEISSQIAGSGSYTMNPYIDIDNFVLSWEDLVTVSVNSCNTFVRYYYGFNGELIEMQLNGEEGYDLGERFYDARLGKMFSVDPLYYEYPWQSAYAYCRNNPIWIIDVDGLGDNPNIYGQVNSNEGLIAFCNRYAISGVSLIDKMDAVAKMNPTVFQGYETWSVGKTNQEKWAYFTGKTELNYHLTSGMLLQLPTDRVEYQRMFTFNLNKQMIPLDDGYIKSNPKSKVFFKNNTTSGAQSKTSPSVKSTVAKKPTYNFIESLGNNLRRFDSYVQGHNEPTLSANDVFRLQAGGLGFQGESFYGGGSGQSFDVIETYDGYHLYSSTKIGSGYSIGGSLQYNFGTYNGNRKPTSGTYVGPSVYFSFNFILGVTYSRSTDGTWNNFSISCGPELGFSSGSVFTKKIK